MRRISTPIKTTELCSYGCGNPAQFINGSKRLMCCKSSNSCPANKKKISEGLKKCGRDYVETYKNLPQDSKNKMAWARGLTKDTDERILKNAINQVGRRKITDEERLRKVLYREQCQFNLAGVIERVQGFDLLQKFGMYDKRVNKTGVVRDHIISVHYGYIHSIDPKIISHPANCQFLVHKDNAKKSMKCDITVDELMERIRKWDCEGNWNTLLDESQQFASSNLANPTK